MPRESPCRSCGACCAVLPVLFPDHEGSTVPLDLREVALPGHSRMRRNPHGGCIAFQGDVGRFTGCGIYDDRPVPCRAFEPSTSEEPNPYCDAARASFGLPLLR